LLWHIVFEALIVGEGRNPHIWWECPSCGTWILQW